VTKGRFKGYDRKLQYPYYVGLLQKQENMTDGSTETYIRAHKIIHRDVVCGRGNRDQLLRISTQESLVRDPRQEFDSLEQNKVGGVWCKPVLC
jgi:hypothetical protein